jgi:hypothetical protein
LRLTVAYSYWNNNGSALGSNMMHWADNAEDDPVPSPNTAGYMAQWPSNTQSNKQVLRKPYNKNNPDPRPKNVQWRKVVRDGGIAPPDNGFFDPNATYLGAFEKGRPKTIWFRPWAAFPPN